ncbi:MAG TPA: polysaccharide deacetylase [Casimicrobiaceae bacterium]|nr:polysaccharide deacetylase [Casimicrobiaceae bacterium]
MPRHLVCVTFDFDAMSGLIARGLTTPTFISRGEFGAVAVPRILALLRKYGVKSTFYIPGFTLETYPRESAAIAEAGHEIAHHGWTHVPPNDLTREQEEAGLVRANEQIRKLSGQYARGYRSPSWDLSPNSMDLLLKHGFLYDSSMMADDYTPYRVRQGDIVEVEKPMVFGKPTRLIEMPIAWSLDDFPHFEFLRMKTSLMPGLMNANSVMENWINDFVYLKDNFDWGVLTYTFHPYVIGRGHRMMALEHLLRTVAEGGAQFVSMEDAAREYDGRMPFSG